MKGQGKGIDPEELLLFMGVLERLKNTTRHSWTSKRRHESVAEHSWRLAVMALILKPHVSDLDVQRILVMALLHDLGEAVNGDIPAFRKTDEDGRNERKDLDQLLGNHESILGAEIIRTVVEYLDQTTPEARFLDAIDRLEALIQHNEAPLDTWTKDDHKYSLTYGQKETEGFEILRTLRHVVKEETVRKTGSGSASRSISGSIDGFTVSTDKAKLDVAAIHDFLSNRSYWAKGRSLETVQKAIDNSFAFGIYDETERLVGFCRVVTDFAVFAYLMDVFILEPYRGRGLGKKLMNYVFSHTLEKVEKWYLATDDAHGLYNQYGFTPLTAPEKFMARLKRE
jgi:5'-deoxynucleotidase YfbR-like HD superfamily hydrolase/GNAT superfamily N-acetyltransferase